MDSRMTLNASITRFMLDVSPLKSRKLGNRDPHRRIVALVNMIPMRRFSYAVQPYRLNACDWLVARSASHRVRANRAGSQAAGDASHNEIQPFEDRYNHRNEHHRNS